MDSVLPNLDHAALLLIDFQQEFVQGHLVDSAAPIALAQAIQVLTAARRTRLPIIHTQEVHRKQLVDFGRELDGAEPIHCLEQEPGTAFYPAMVPIEAEFTITKRRYSAFFATDLEILLKGLKVDTLILMGALTNVCVHYTAVDAHQHDYQFYVLEDCCIGSDAAAHHSALKAMHYLQRRSVITSSQFLTALNSLLHPV